MIFIVVLYFLTILIAIIAFWYARVWYFYSGLKTITGPSLVPLLGNVLDFPNSASYIPVLTKYCRDNNRTARLQLAQYSSLVVADCEIAELILSSKDLLSKSVFYKYLDSWIGTGLLTGDGTKWKKHRKMITPAFHFQILDQFLAVFDKNGKIFIEKLKKMQGPVNVQSEVPLLTLDIICETAMGTTVNAQSTKDLLYVKSIKTASRILLERMFSLIENFDTTYRFTKNYRQEKEALEVIHNYTYSVIKSRREMLKTTNLSTNSKDDDVGQKKKIALLDLLLASTIDGKPLTDKEIQEEVDTFMFAGHDTTAAGVIFTLYLLAQHPNVQQKVYSEQKEIFEADPNRCPTMADLNNMRYLEQVIKESVRLYPPVPYHSREVTQDCALTKDIFLKKGLQLFIFVHELHRDERYFPDSERFDPERFSVENAMKLHPFVYVPFSAGSRNCIGQKFAMLELKSILSKVIRNFVVKPANDMPEMMLVSEVVLKSANGVFVNFEKRE